MPTLYTALLARHGGMPKASRVAGVIQEKPPFARTLLSESVGLPPAQPREGASVIVVGAGFAGLAAAYELLHAGYRVKVLEAQRRIGGRVQSLTDVVPGKNVEGGGELIGENHAAWLSYMEKFGLQFTNVHDGENAPIILRGHRLRKEQEKVLVDQMEQVLDELVTLSDSVRDPFRPWLSPGAPDLDRMSLQSWLDSSPADSLCRYAVGLQFATDNGVPAARQSMLGVLAMIKGGGGRKYFTETERYRCSGGNQQLAAKLAEPLGDALHLGLRVTTVRNSNAGMEVDTLDRQNNRQTFSAKHVVLAIAPSVWSRVTFDTDAIRKLKPQMGRNVKCLLSFSSEYWKQSKLSPNMTSDGPVELTWHATEEQEGPGQALVAFSGADQAGECMRWKPVARLGRYVREISRAYRGTERALVDGRFRNWPEDPFVMASYAFPAPNEVTRCGPVFEKGIGNLHFAGEHTCYAFIGYMEGALQSGIRVCNRVMVSDGFAGPLS